MKKSTKVWLIVAGCLILLGAILFAVTMTMNQWNFQVVLRAKNEIREFVVDEDFEDIKILTTTEDITILPSIDGKCKVVFNVPSSYEVKADVEERGLNVCTLNSSDIMSLIRNFEFGIDGNTSVTIYLPALRYGKVEISDTTGDIDIEGLRAGGLGISTTTGNVHMHNSQCGDVSADTTTGDVGFEGVTCDGLYSKGTTGDITLRRVIAGGKIVIERGTGNVALDGCDAKELEISTSTGDVTGTLLSGKQFVVKSNTGDISVPESKGASGDVADGTCGTCAITTGTGDIVLEEYKE